ncbi:MAG: GntR family transcriptional regulator [Propionicimonas sp.]|uniref:GntR family transcriptional regulator n=1 Tax=Propionicimonas sp. TaxID=1955623 RepID=UPI003D0D5A3D
MDAVNTVVWTPLDRASSTPVWLQICGQIERLIREDTWIEGTRLPSEPQLCEQFGASRTSVRTAIDHLRSAGLVYSRRGSGTYVAGLAGSPNWVLPTTASVLGGVNLHGKSPLESIVLKGRIETLPPWAVRLLECNVGEEGFALERLRFLRGQPAVLVTDYLPRWFIGLLADLRDPRASLFEKLGSVAGVKITHVRRTIEAASTDHHTSPLLEIEEGRPIAIVEAVAFGDGERPVAASRALVRTDRLRLCADSIEPAGAWEAPRGPDLADVPLRTVASPGGVHRRRASAKERHVFQ